MVAIGDVPGRLLPPPRQEAQAVPDPHGPETSGGRGHGDDLHLRPGPVRRHARRHRGSPEAGPVRDLHLEGRRPGAVQAGAHRRGRPGRRGHGHLRLVRQPGRAPAVQALPAGRARAGVPRLLRRAGGSSTCAATAATTARSSSSTTPSASWAATTSAPPTPPSGATRTAGSPVPRSGTSTRAFADFWNLHRASGSGTASADAARRPLDWEPRIRVHRNVPRLWMFPIRAMYIEAMNRARATVDDPGLLHPRRGLRRRARGRRAARGRRTPAPPGEVQPHRGRLDLAGLLRRAARRGASDPPFRDAMVHAKTATIDGHWTTIGTANSTGSP